MLGQARLRRWSMGSATGPKLCLAQRSKVKKEKFIRLSLHRRSLCPLIRVGHKKKKNAYVYIRGGVLEDTFRSPWPRMSSPWPRGLKSSKIGLSSARGQHCFLSC